MGLAEIQGALARLYVDPALRDRFFADPAGVGVELGLGAEESRDLAGVSRRQVEQFADSLRRKRRDQVRRVIPIAARALGDRFGGLFERYVASRRRGGRGPISTTRSGSSMRSGDGPIRSTAWAVDLARYELAWRQAARAGRRPIVRMFRFPVGTGSAANARCAGSLPRRADPAPSGGVRPGRGRSSGTSSSGFPALRSSMSSSRRAAISGGKPAAPALVDEPDVEQVQEMDLILEPEGRQLHADQGVQGGHGEVGARLGLGDLGSRQQDSPAAPSRRRTRYGWRSAPSPRGHPGTGRRPRRSDG